MEECLVSVIIPIYNVDKYLNICIKSVVTQTYKNLEIILVDDNSPDKSPIICDEWCKKDKRIVVLHKQQNQGLGEARNSGLDLSNGKYVLFLDSDDFIEDDSIRQLVEAAERENADIVGSGEYKLENNGTKTISIVPEKYNVYRGKVIISEFLPNIIAPDPISKKRVGFNLCMSGPLFSSRILKNNGWRCVSEREIISEDTYSFIDLCSNVNCVVELPIVTMNYRVNPKSLSRSFREDRREKNIYFYNETVKLAKYKGYGCNIESRLVSTFISFVISDLKQICNADVTNKTELIYNYLEDEKIISIIKKADSRGETFTRKIFIFLLKHRFTWFAYKLIKLKAGGN